jgi:diguanylate cyclase (GGDEF)-like protein
MDELTSVPSETRSATEQLLEDSWETRERTGASRRELTVEASAAALFGVAAVTLLMAAGVPENWHPGLAALLVVAYTVVARVEFPVGAGYVVPTQLTLVPMLVLLPPAVVPVAVCAALVASTTLDWVRGRAAPRRILASVPDASHALGPAVVLAIANPAHIGLAELPIMAVAFAACCLIDLLVSLARGWLIGLVPDLSVQIRVIMTVWAVDASLAPLGFLAAVQGRQQPANVLFVLPLAALLWGLARDRSARIQQAHERLKLVEQERLRLQSAVRRLGDAFAAKLELDALLEILLQGLVEALDAAAGRLDLSGLPTWQTLQTGAPAGLRALETGAGEQSGPAPLQSEVSGGWVLRIPVRIPSSPRDVMGTLAVARPGRSFEVDEIELTTELTAKAVMAAAGILAHHALREQAVTDALTGLGNRRQLSTDLAIAFERAASGQPSLLLLFDLDGFKSYNDTFGHLAGDALLARLGTKLAHSVAGHGSAYRLGGDEFCARIELTGADPGELISRAAAALTDSGGQFNVHASVGVVLLPHEADSPDHALQLADERMYVNKRARSGGARNQARDVLMRTMEAKQPDLDEHSSSVAALAVRVARHFGLGGEQLDEVGRAAELHDVGKVGIPDAILNNPGELSQIEWDFVHQHTILGERILNAAPALRPIARLVRASHESWDGTGYPDHLVGEQIPLGSRIVAVCDAYQAMTPNRPYRQAVSDVEARRELRAAAGSQFDPAVVEAFLEALDQDVPVAERDAVGEASTHVRTLLALAPAATLAAGLEP